MPKGLHGILSGDSWGKFILVISDEDEDVGDGTISIPILLQNFISSRLTNGNVTKIHIVAFANDFSSLMEDTRNSPIILYDYLKSPFPGISSLFKSIISDPSPIPGRPHNASDNFANIVLIDSFQLFTIHCEKDWGRVLLFFRLLAQRQGTVFGILDPSSLPDREKTYFIKQADVLVRLIRLSENKKESSSCFCDILRFGSNGGKIHREKSTLKVQDDGKIIETLFIENDASFSGSTSEQEKLLTNLTTFKLTIEEDEKESKSRLHLPYFDAQRKDVQDPEPNLFDDEDDDVDYDDEEDEEV